MFNRVNKKSKLMKILETWKLEFDLWILIIDLKGSISTEVRAVYVKGHELSGGKNFMVLFRERWKQAF